MTKLPNTVIIKSSSIHGKGLFANESIKAGTSLGEAVVTNNGVYITKLGSYVNHQDEANVELKPTSSGYDLVATKDVEKGAELVGDYNQAPWFIKRAEKHWKNIMTKEQELAVAYTEGFMHKCAEHGIDKETAIKLAQEATDKGRMSAYLHQLLPGWGPLLYGIDTKPEEASSAWEGLKSMLATGAGQVGGGLAGGALGGALGGAAGGKKGLLAALPASLIGAILGGGEALHATQGD